MYIDNSEAAYLIGRLQISQDMAKSARGPCARHAHEEFAMRYRSKLASLLRSTSSVALRAPIADALPAGLNTQA